MPLSYIGGKSRISKFITPFYDKEMETYVEVFGGMFWCFFNMDLESYPNLKNIVYNDFNPLNANLFRCLKEDHNKLLNECEKVPVQLKGQYPTPPECSEFFYKAQNELYSKNLDIIENDYKLAAKHALVLSSVFSGANPEKSKFIDLKGKYHSKFTSFINKLKNPKWQRLFESITNVENMDFEDVINKWDSPTTYIYTDPPYYIVGEGSYYSNHVFSRSDHERLSESLKNMRGKFSLSYYHFDQLEEWFPRNIYKWESKEFSKAAGAKSGEKQSKGEELLIMNYGI